MSTTKSEYSRETVTAFVAATRAVIDAIARGERGIGGWGQGLRAWSKTLIPGRPGDAFYRTKAVEAHGDTLCVGIELDGHWFVVEIDEPVGFDPAQPSLRDARELRLYSQDAWRANAGWRASACEKFAREAGFDDVF
ncbi:MAG: hypothetical protein U0269_17130 [Polyangiales bacterium]